MAARCAVCGRGPQVGYSVSHSHIRNKRTFRPNLQPVHTTVDGENVYENNNVKKRIVYISDDVFFFHNSNRRITSF